MIAKLTNVLADLSVDEPINWNRMRLHPLRLRAPGDLEYLTLGDSGCEGLVTVEETSAYGTVPELRVCNRSKCCLFIPEGSTLIGAKQNRIVNISILLAPESVTIIPVSCVERGRWQMQALHFAAGGFADSPLRAKMCKSATEGLKRGGKVQVNQGEVWSHVDGMLHGAGAFSSTAAYHALYEKWQPELAEFQAKFRLPETACGVAVEIDGALQAVDLFDKPQTLHKLWPRLASSYLLASLRSGSLQGKKTEVRSFLERVFQTHGESYEPAGIGTTVRLANHEAVGAALVCDEHLVHLSVFADETAAPPRAAPTSSPAPGNPSPSGPTQVRRPRPWWRLWA